MLHTGYTDRSYDVSIFDGRITITGTTRGLSLQVPLPETNAIDPHGEILGLGELASVAEAAITRLQFVHSCELARTALYAMACGMDLDEARKAIATHHDADRRSRGLLGGLLASQGWHNGGLDMMHPGDAYVHLPTGHAIVNVVTPKDVAANGIQLRELDGSRVDEAALPDGDWWRYDNWRTRAQARGEAAVHDDTTYPVLPINVDNLIDYI